MNVCFRTCNHNFVPTCSKLNKWHRLTTFFTTIFHLFSSFCRSGSFIVKLYRNRTLGWLLDCSVAQFAKWKFVEWSLLTNHTKFHSGEWPWECVDCSKKVFNLADAYIVGWLRVSIESTGKLLPITITTKFWVRPLYHHETVLSL